MLGICLYSFILCYFLSLLQDFKTEGITFCHISSMIQRKIICSPQRKTLRLQVVSTLRSNIMGVCHYPCDISAFVWDQEEMPSWDSLKVMSSQKQRGVRSSSGSSCRWAEGTLLWAPDIRSGDADAYCLVVWGRLAQNRAWLCPGLSRTLLLQVGLEAGCETAPREEALSHVHRCLVSTAF